MLVVIALGGNALLRRGQPMTAENQRANVRIAAQALAPIAAEHRLVITHGNGPQVGLLALQGAAYEKVETYPLDALGAQTEGMIGYMVEQELGNLLPFERPFATLLTMVEVDGKDPAFGSPSKFIGPVYAKEDADHLAHEKDGPSRKTARHGGASWPLQAQAHLRAPSIKWLLEAEHDCRGGGGGGSRRYEQWQAQLVGVECVIDKDLASELLARELGADLFVMLTDAEAVYSNWGKPTRRAIRRVSPSVLKALPFAAGSMGPKVDAACRFATATGKRAAIGALADLGRIVAGEPARRCRSEAGIVYGAPIQALKNGWRLRSDDRAWIAGLHGHRRRQHGGRGLLSRAVRVGAIGALAFSRGS